MDVNTGRRKPGDVVPQHRRRAVTVWITLLLAIIACERLVLCIYPAQSVHRPWMYGRQQQDGSITLAHREDLAVWRTTQTAVAEKLELFPSVVRNQPFPGYSERAIVQSPAGKHRLDSHR